MANKVLVSCDTCGTEILKFPSLVRDNNFCTRSCYYEWRKSRTGSINPNWKGGIQQVECEQCRAMFDVQPGAVVRSRFCSVRCKALSQESHQACLHCKTEFKGHRHKFCTHACSVAYHKIHPVKFSEEAKRNISKSKEGSAGLSGPLNPAWKDGRAVLPYTKGFTRNTKRAIKERDSFRCVVCNSRTKVLHVHHLDCEKINHSGSNLITLCPSCHFHLHWGTLYKPVPLPLL